jgi:DNA topoisomerase-2
MSTKKLEKYQKLSQLEHILKLPDTYIGSIEKTIDDTYVYIETDNKIVKKEVEYVPGLYKIFDEILVNAVDHHTRSHNDPNEENVKYIKVNISKETNTISVKNEGGIPIEEHPTIKNDKGKPIYIPELIFAHLLTSSNYDSGEDKIVGGKNGYGAKLTNIFSTEFTITTISNGKKYVQIFNDNMSIINKPSITKCVTKAYTEIVFKPDLKRFNMTDLNDDIISLMMRRVIDVTSYTEKYLVVELNGKKLLAKSLEKYMDYYFNETVTTFCIKPNERWEIGIVLNPEQKFEQISFVNGISTTKGGKHVDYIINQICKKLIPIIEKKSKTTIKANYIKDNIYLFLRSTIVNPSFDSQTKEYLTTNQSKFGSTCEIDKKFIEKLAKSDITKRIIELTEFKENIKTKKTDGKKKNVIKGIAKLEDANKAGTKDSDKCILNLTEGDSAKAFVMGGIKNKDYEGIFPLKGKLINVRGDVKKANENEEIKNIKKILGLQEFEPNTNKPKIYTSIDELRYGKVRLCMDQDVDGSHIKGLFMNFIETKWPSLLKLNFIISLVTPIVKVTSKNKKDIVSFYTLTHYEIWKETNDIKNWNIKYYKGLGTSTSKEAKEYFSNLAKNTIRYNACDECSDRLSLAFDKKKTHERKNWLKEFDKNKIIERDQKNITYSEFIDKELIHFSDYDNVRSIPSMMDGLKPSQRKIIFSCIKKNLKNEIKVAQFSGYVSEHSAYHHGEVSLQGAIISMAQDFVGSNNINLLEPIGQFGTRLQGGKDHASARYIFTKLNELTTYIYKKEDNYLLNYQNDDGLSIEPDFYLPIIPMILINGTEGIGTGFSTKVPCHNPLDIIHSIKNLINDKELDIVLPWYRDFKGKILVPDWNGKDYNEINKMYSKGSYTIKNNDLIISELPIGIWTDNYKEFLEKLLEKDMYIDSYISKSTDLLVKFEIKCKPNVIQSMGLKLEDIFKLKESKQVNTSNMHLYNIDNKIMKYENVVNIMNEWYQNRLPYYHKRYAYLIDKLKYELKIIVAKIKFINGIINEEISIFKKEDDEVNQILEDYELDKISKIHFEDLKHNTEEPNFNYLLNMAMRTMTKKKMDELEKLKADLESQLKDLEEKTPTQLWLNDLNDFEDMYYRINNITKTSKPSKTNIVKIKV